MFIKFQNKTAISPDAPFPISCFSDDTDTTGGTSSSEGQPPAPQVRTAGEGRDLLTCGQCSQAFPLAHILAFIQHKQGGCLSRNQGVDVNTMPPSPAIRAQERAASAALGPGFIELRRGTARDRAWGEEPGVKLRAEASITGECLKTAGC